MNARHRRRFPIQSMASMSVEDDMKSVRAGECRRVSGESERERERPAHEVDHLGASRPKVKSRSFGCTFQSVLWNERDTNVVQDIE